MDSENEILIKLGLSEYIDNSDNLFEKLYKNYPDNLYHLDYVPCITKSYTKFSQFEDLYVRKNSYLNKHNLYNLIRTRFLRLYELIWLYYDIYFENTPELKRIISKYHPKDKCKLYDLIVIENLKELHDLVEFNLNDKSISFFIPNLKTILWGGGLTNCLFCNDKKSLDFIKNIAQTEGLYIYKKDSSEEWITPLTYNKNEN